MRDADLLDLLEILGDMTEAIASLAEGHRELSGTFVSTSLAQRKIDSFRSAIRQRMNHAESEV